MTSELPTTEPLLRTLAPLMRNLEKDLRGWLDGTHRYPLPMISRASLEGMATDLHRQSDALDVDRPLLVVMLMGGTGVGKSTLLNALAGAPIAQASYTRPTTRDPVVYYHQSIRSDRLDPALRHCRLVQHDRESLAQKILVDTPDLDSNDLSNRDKLLALLPMADIVLYVGSQEKYHDKLGWELFKEQRKRRAFAFVLNKWDRCLQSGASGLRPDEDLLRDLTAEGFENPKLFRTVAQTWLDFRSKSGPWMGSSGQSENKDSSPTKPEGLPEGEQFSELLNWLELGLTRLEIEAVKARGVGQLLSQIVKGIDGVRPPDLTAEASRTRAAWERILHEEAAVHGDVLLGTLDPYQAEIERIFSVEGQHQFRGFMGTFLHMTTKFRHAGSTWRGRIPFLPRIGEQVEDAKPTWNLQAFAHECTRVAGDKVLDKRGSALINRLLVEADRCSFPLQLLNTVTDEAAHRDWHDRYDRALIESLAEVEQICTQPRGMRKIIQVTLVTLANFLPEATFIGSIIWLLFRWFAQENFTTSILHVLLPFFLTLLVLLLMQILIALLLPLRWAALRGEFHKQLVDRLEVVMTNVYASIPEETAKQMLAEREQVDRLSTLVKDVLTWLDERQSAASIAGLYGK
ncbi:MAG: 50S ribosome-binding GTPase [Planctomycetes bacterium]|nr:50S ribosome-binding GTPase [Planctomycetota bacterium]